MIDFLGIGAQKAGTSWVAECLKVHPEVCYPKITEGKELFYFNAYDPHQFRYRNFRYGRGKEWYEGHFAHCRADAVKGEVSPTYLYCKAAAKRIKRDYPEVKIIVVLRDPVRRAFSQYLHERRIGLIGKISFEKAIKKNRLILEKSYYAKYLKNYNELFSEKKIFVLLNKDIKKNPQRVLRRLYKFVGVRNIDFVPEIASRKKNAAVEARWPRLNSFLIGIEYFLRKNNLYFVLRWLEATGLRKLVFNVSYYVNRRPLEKYPKMSEETEKRLRKLFRKDVEQLERMIGRNLKDWKN